MTHRHVDVTRFAQIKPASQPAPQLIWADLASLVIDERYQRPLGPRNIAAINKIAANFRWSRFSPVLVAPVEGGEYAIIDGQHRCHAAAICGFERVPAMVVLVAPEEQALAFVEINTGQIRVGGGAVYKAALVAGEPWAVACKAAVDAAGCQLITYNAKTKEKKPGQIYAIALIRKLVEAGEAAAVTAGLRAMLTASPDAVANFDSALLAPWLTAISTDPAFVSADLAGFLRAHKPWIVIENADKYAKENGLPVITCRRDAFVALLRNSMGIAA